MPIRDKLGYEGEGISGIGQGYREMYGLESKMYGLDLTYIV